MKRGFKPISDPVADELWRDLRRRRHELQMTIEDLGEKAKLSPSYISDIENGFRDPSLSTLDAVAEVLETSLGALLGSAPTISAAALKMGRVFDDLPEDLKPTLLAVLYAIAKSKRSQT